MDEPRSTGHDDQIVVDAVHTQLEYFQTTTPCRALELPEGILLRYNLAQSLYFYLRTQVVDGKLATRIFATDTPYDRTKTLIGEVRTPMFAERADHTHLRSLEKYLRQWVRFVQDDPDVSDEFTSFTVDGRADRDS